MNLTAIRERLADTLRDGIGMPINVYPYMPDAPRSPCIVIVPAANYIIPHESFGLHQLVELHFRLLIGAASRAEDAQRLLDSLLSFGDDETSSVIDAIESKRDTANGGLDGLVEDLVIESATTVGPSEPNAQVFEASIAMMILVRR